MGRTAYQAARGYRGLRPSDGFRFSDDVDPAAAYQRRRGERLAHGACNSCAADPVTSDVGRVCHVPSAAGMGGRKPNVVQDCIR